MDVERKGILVLASEPNDSNFGVTESGNLSCAVLLSVLAGGGHSYPSMPGYKALGLLGAREQAMPGKFRFDCTNHRQCKTGQNVKRNYMMSLFYIVT